MTETNISPTIDAALERFMAGIAMSSGSDIIESQIPLATSLLSGIEENGGNPLKALDLITMSQTWDGGPVDSGIIWVQLFYLGKMLENLVKSAVLPEPIEVVDTLLPVAEAARNRIEEIESMKSSRLDSFTPHSQVLQIMHFVDRLSVSPAFLRNLIVQHSGTKSLRLIRQIAPISDLLVNGEINTQSVQFIRSIQTAEFQCRYIASIISSPGIHLVPLRGNIFPFMYDHFVCIALPKVIDLRDLTISEFEDSKPRALTISELNATKPDYPGIGGLIVIDPTIFQAVGKNPLLADILPRDRLEKLREFLPQAFSETGVFVGPFRDYIYFLRLLGQHNPIFEFHEPENVTTEDGKIA